MSIVTESTEQTWQAKTGWLGERLEKHLSNHPLNPQWSLPGPKGAIWDTYCNRQNNGNTNIKCLKNRVLMVIENTVSGSAPDLQLVFNWVVPWSIVVHYIGNRALVYSSTTI